MTTRLLTIDEEQITKIGKELQKIHIEEDPFTDPRYYPPLEDDYEHVVSYFFTMVAIDHRTSIFKEYRAKIGEEEYRGADLLWRLGIEMYERDPEFFLPQNLAKMTLDTVRKWLTIDRTEIWDPGTRALLLQDLGKKTVIYYNSKFTNILKKSQGKIRGENSITTLLKHYRAYEDPVEKKTFLLIKFLTRRKLIQIKDPENLELPIDNHLTRIAIRTGIVEPSQELEKLIQKEVELDRETDIEIRLTIRQAWKKLTQETGIEPTKLDDYLWNHGRKTCTPENPKCNKCPLKNTCKANQTEKYLKEHKHQLTWYY
ncbi:MAG: N-glycosylase/DNA lyase [Crenarchaeota archaeon]|nr:N-glycosylase/DNA lyase [Thermoproteota archaeon]